MIWRFPICKYKNYKSGADRSQSLSQKYKLVFTTVYMHALKTSCEKAVSSSRSVPVVWLLSPWTSSHRTTSYVRRYAVPRSCCWLLEIILPNPWWRFCFCPTSWATILQDRMCLVMRPWSLGWGCSEVRLNSVLTSLHVWLDVVANVLQVCSIMRLRCWPC